MPKSILPADHLYHRPMTRETIRLLIENLSAAPQKFEETELLCPLNQLVTVKLAKAINALDTSGNPPIRPDELKNDPWNQAVINRLMQVVLP